MDYKRFSQTSPRIIYVPNQLIEMKWHQRNKRIYTQLGYDFTAIGDTFSISPEHLSPSSPAIIRVICPLCGNERESISDNIRKRQHSYCKGCAHAQDLTDATFNRLTAISWDSATDGRGGSMWLCRCECGEYTVVRADSLKDGSIKSCGCLYRDVMAELVGTNHPFHKPIVGNKYGRLTATKLIDSQTHLCECECGNIVEVATRHLRSGGTQSCGCYQTEMRLGSNNPSWNPNKTDEERQQARSYLGYFQFLKDVHRRDNHTCVACGHRNKNNPVHHICDFASHPHLRTEPQNGVVLCKSCHDDFHWNYMGRTNTTCTLSDFANWLHTKQLQSSQTLLVQTNC